MTALTRRRLMAVAAGSAPLIALGNPAKALAAKGNVLLVHDDTLPAARRFAMRARLLGLPSQALEGDRVPLFRRWLAPRPALVFGMTRHADRLLLAEIAREMGYEDLAAIQHRKGRDTLMQGNRALASLSETAGPCWPEAFAQWATGAGSKTVPPALHAQAEPGFSWVLRNKA
ncbi:hypothetical protein [Novosphingobium terrae]|uniref:hypothetical protein n=1 Tax=Novosphingobium terrae TaxID=2726189 RepID=UPI00197D8234|nr:hypothetical protein [Novosphingobium terrae]